MAYDPTERLAALRDDIDLLDQTYGKAAEASRIAVTEYDRTGTVTATVDADGQLQKVAIAANWTRHHQPAELGAAVREALDAVAVARAHAWGESIANAREPQAVRPAPRLDTDLAAKVDAAQARGVDSDEVLGALRDLLLEMNEAVDTATAQADALATAEFRARSSSGHVTATVGGNGDLVALDFEQPWVETAHPTNLGRESTEAILAARGLQQREGVQAILAAGPLAEAGRLSQDPAALLRRLRVE